MRSGSKKETPKTAIHMCFDTEYCGNKEVQLSNFYKRQDLGTCVPSGKFTLDNKAGEIVTVPLKDLGRHSAAEGGKHYIWHGTSEARQGEVTDSHVVPDAV